MAKDKALREKLTLRKKLRKAQQAYSKGSCVICGCNIDLRDKHYLTTSGLICSTTCFNL